MVVRPGGRISLTAPTDSPNSVDNLSRDGSAMSRGGAIGRQAMLLASIKPTTMNAGATLHQPAVDSFSTPVSVA